MVLYKKSRQIIFMSIIAVLVAALVASTVIIIKKNNYIKEIKSQISNNEALIEQEGKKYDELKKQYDESQKQNSDIKKKLEDSEAAKKKLEQENSSLKKTIQQLKAEKSQAAPNNAANNKATPANKVCYLTFDDGPSPVTLRILDTLKKYNVKATFFVINSKYNSYLSNIAADGHTIALHSYSHNYSTVYRSVDNYFADLNSISNIVKQYTGVESKVIRFPGGSSNTTSKKYCRGIMTTLAKDVQNKGYSYFDWNVSSGDAEPGRVSKQKIVNNVLNSSRNKNSVCVLMHDAAAKTTTADALPEIIVGLRNMGFRFEALTPKSYGYHHGINN